MLDWLFQAGSNGPLLGALGFVTGIASLLYARSQARGANAQVEGARAQAVEALRAAGLVAENGRLQAAEAVHAAKLVADNAREQAVEALRAAGLVAESARQQAVEALRAAGLVAESARQQAVEALRAAELLANSAVSARVREMRARHFRANPNLPGDVQEIIKQVGGPDAYSVMLDSMDIAQEIYFLRKRGMVSDEQWRMWMNDQMVPIAQSPSFQDVFHRAANQGVLFAEFVKAFQPVLQGQRIADPWDAQRTVPGRTQVSADAERGEGNGSAEVEPATGPPTSPVAASPAAPGKAPEPTGDLVPAPVPAPSSAAAVPGL